MDNWELIDKYVDYLRKNNSHIEHLDRFLVGVLKTALKVTLDNPVISRENILKILEEAQWLS
jgi:hypothetical protein